MAKKKVKPINLDNAISQILAQYGNSVYDVLNESVKEVSDEAAEKLRAVDHFAPGRTPSGDYSGSWTNEPVPVGRFSVKNVVHNEEHYRLTHLLENGHVSRNGTGRTFGRVQAYPHIAPVNEWANSELPRMIERKLK